MRSQYLLSIKERKGHFYLATHSTHFITVIWHQTYGKGPLSERENRCCHIGYSLRLAARKCFYLTTHSTHLVMVIWRRTIQIAREVTWCHHMGYSFLLTARVLLYAQSLRQDSTYHSLCYTSRGVLAGTRNTFKLKHSQGNSVTYTHTQHFIYFLISELREQFSFWGVVKHSFIHSSRTKLLHSKHLFSFGEDIVSFRTEDATTQLII